MDPIFNIFIINHTRIIQYFINTMVTAFPFVLSNF